MVVGNIEMPNTSKFCKILQRKLYDLLSQKYGLLISIFLIISVIISAIQFGEVSKCYFCYYRSFALVVCFSFFFMVIKAYQLV